jgi:carboxypeptidase family protein
MRSVIALAIVAMASARAAGAQVAAPPRDRPNASASTGTATISGRVVDAQTGKPIARARVWLEWSGSSRPRPSVATDSSGGFAFTRLPSGSFMIGVEKSTFLSTRYPPSRQTFRTSGEPVPIKDGQAIDDIVVPMYHAAAITGRVLDANGDPVEGVTVQALRLSNSGKPQPRSGGASSNDAGEFRISRLEPGEYLLLATPQQRYFDGPDASNPAEQVETTTFYPGVWSMTDAQPVAVARGATVAGIDLQLVEGQAARVSGRIVDSTGQPITNGGSMLVRPVFKALGFPSLGVNGVGVNQDGTFQLTLPYGEYELVGQASDPPRPGSPVWSGTQRVGIARLTVGGDISDIAIELLPPAKVSGHFVFDGTHPVPAVSSWNGIATIGFTSRDGSCRSMPTATAQDWTFTADVSGSCAMRLYATFPPWFVTAIRHNGEDLLEKPVTFMPGQHVRGIEIVMTDRPTELTFHVTDNGGEPTRDYVGLVFAADKSRWTADIAGLFVRPLVPPRESPSSSSSATPGQGTQMDAVNPNRGGRDLMVGLPPGEYFAVAVDDLDTETFRDPEVLERLSRTATRVTLADGAHADVYLRRMKAQ